MQYSKTKNIILVIIPAITFFLYQKIQINMQMKANYMLDRLPITLFNMLVPCAIGVFAFFLVAYVYHNRNSLIFISMFCGAFLVNTLYVAFMLGLFGLRRNAIDMSAASQVAYVLMGTYGTAFWVSIISYIRGRKKRGGS